MFRWIAIVFFTLGLMLGTGWFARSAFLASGAAQDIPIVTAPRAVDHKCPSDPKSSASEDDSVAYGGEVAVSFPDLGDFCGKWAKNPLCEARTGRKLTFSEVSEQDKTLRTTFQYTSDQSMYQKSDFWAENAFCGDCEDYALTLARRLADAGAGGDTMWLEIWNPGWVGGHASLLVATADQGWVEVNVWKGGEPTKFEETPVRLGRITLDGRRQVQVYEGVTLETHIGYSVLRKTDTRAEAIAGGYIKE